MKHPKQKTGRRQREALVYKHLEGAARELLEEHRDIIRRFIGKNAGIYALYRKDKLRYIGLASKLGHRLIAHLRDRHKSSWDRFSIYLTIKDQHIKEIESLLLQIARPIDNKVGGKPKGSKDLRPAIKNAIRDKQKAEADILIGKPGAKYGVKTLLRQHETAVELASLLPEGAKLKGIRSGKTFKGLASRSGKVRFDNQWYPSLSAAGSAAMGKPVNGWYFWHVERSRGNWVRLSEIRRAGTPLI